MTVYSITVKNSSNNNDRSYNIYSSLPTISNDGYGNMLKVVWAKIDGLPKNGKDTFTYTSDFYAFAGRSSVNSNSLATSTTISSRTSTVVTLGDDNDDGDVMLINKDLELTRNDGGATNGSFEFKTKADIPSPNSYVMGVARKMNDDDPAPVAVVELKPRVKAAAVKPLRSVIITVGSLDPGKVNKDALGEAATVDFSGGQRTAVVTEGANGKFTVEIK